LGAAFLGAAFLGAELPLHPVRLSAARPTAALDSIRRWAWVRLIMIIPIVQ
jgi:hypothetical protein